MTLLGVGTGTRCRAEGDETELEAEDIAIERGEQCLPRLFDRLPRRTKLCIYSSTSFCLVTLACAGVDEASEQPRK